MPFNILTLRIVKCKKANMKLNENTKMKLILLGLILFSILCVTVPLILHINPLHFGWFMMGYLFFDVLLSAIAKKLNNKILNKIAEINTYSLYIIFIILQIGLPTLVLLFCAALLFIITFGIPLILINSIETIFELGIKMPTMIFLSLSTASILSAYLSKYLLNFILKIATMLNDPYGDKPQQAQLKEFVTMFYQKNNVIFLIYFCYFIYLIVTAFYKIQFEKSIFDDSEIDLAILQSFLVFLAFSNMIVKSKDVTLTAQSLLRIYLKIFFSKKNDEK